MAAVRRFSYSGFGALYQNYENLGIKKAAPADAEAAKSFNKRY